MTRKNVIFTVLSLSVILAVNFFAFSQDKKTPDLSVEKESGLDAYIEYLEFREVDIKNVLRQLAKQYNLNIVFSESVKGLITVQLHDVTIDRALDSIVTINGFVYSKKDNVIKITTAAEADKEGKQTRVFHLNNADASKLKDTLAKTLSSEGRIDADARSNALIITDNIAVINKLEGMIPKLDNTTMQVLIEARFIETSLGTSESLGIDWNTAISASGSKRPTTFPFEANTKSTDSKFFPNVQVPDSLETTKTATIDSLGNTIETASQTVLKKLAAGFPETPTDLSASSFLFGSLDFSQLKVTLNFLESRTGTRLLSAPRIVTTDNKEAIIKVGQTVRVLSDQKYDEVAKQTTTNYVATDVGVILRVTPQVSPDNRIRLKLNPEVSSVVGYNQGTAIPIIGQRSAETEVVIKDGQTIVIGGLVQSQDSNTEKGLPFLGKIPFLGKLFSQNTNNPTKTELFIFVTARIVRENEGAVLAMDTGMKLSPLRPMKLKLRSVVLDKNSKK